MTVQVKYAAHLILAVRYADGPADAIPCYENVVLIDGRSDDDALAKAVALGEAEAADVDTSFTWAGRPARWEFVGVRKLIACQPAGPGTRIGHGAELTYSQLAVRTEADLRKLAAGEPVDIVYAE